MKKIVCAILVVISCNSSAMDTPENQKAKQLWDAIMAGDRTQFDRLLSEGVSPLVPYAYQENKSRLPVICAICHYQSDMVAKLLETYPEKQITGNKEGTLMHFAAMKGAFECIPLLLSYGAEIDDITVSLATGVMTCCTKERKQATIKEIKRLLALKNESGKSYSNKAHKD